jgi:molecular chaperone HtpG
MSDNTEYQFQTDIVQLMHLIVNAFYSNKDIFLRELISNASDALDKVRYLSLTDPSMKDNTELSIKIIPNQENKTLTITDTGIGMTREDLVNNLGTIASSGTKKFMDFMHSKNPQEKLDTNLIGKFGVGFYSAFLVANSVTVFTRHNNDDGYVWESNMENKYTVKKCEDDLPHGTKIVLHMKEDCLEYLEEKKIKEIVKSHSQFIMFPIYQAVMKTTTEGDKSTEGDRQDQIDESVEDDESTKNVDGVKIEDIDEDEEKKQKSSVEFEHLNKHKPIWARDPKDVSNEEYASFYKLISEDWEEHLHVKHFNVESQTGSLRGLLFIPKRTPFDLLQSEKKQKNIKLYVKKVFITDDCSEFVPPWMSFVKGVIDSDDLQLNVSREMLQQTKEFKVIKKQLVNKVIDMMYELVEDPEKYKTFYENFSRNIKLAVHDEEGKTEKLAGLLRFNSTNVPDLISLDQYIETMPASGKIYYITGDKDAVYNPCLEIFKKKNLNVLLLLDPIDEYITMKLKTYKNVELVSVTKDGLKLDETEEEKNERDELNKKLEPLCKAIKDILKNSVEKVVVSNKLTESPCAVVSGQQGYSANMERIVRAQALGDPNMLKFMASRKILELNPHDELVNNLSTKLEQKEKIDNLVIMMYEAALFSSGFSLDNPASFSKRVYNIMKLHTSNKDVELENNALHSDENQHYGQNKLDGVDDDEESLDEQYNVDTEHDDHEHVHGKKCHHEHENEHLDESKSVLEQLD